MKEIKCCSLCLHEAEADWVFIDPESEWMSYIGCSSDLCDTMLSLEVPRLKKKDMLLIEETLIDAWNRIHG